MFGKLRKFEKCKKFWKLREFGKLGEFGKLREPKEFGQEVWETQTLQALRLLLTAP